MEGPKDYFRNIYAQTGQCKLIITIIIISIDRGPTVVQQQIFQTFQCSSERSVCCMSSLPLNSDTVSYINIFVQLA